MEGSTYTVQLENFAGPLDLLLQLIEKNKLDICDVSLATVTNDYLESIQNIELDPAQANWFLDIASRLILYKSRALLPNNDLEVQQPLEDLTEQLHELSEIRALTKQLAENQKPTLIFLKKTSTQNMPIKFSNLEIESLVDAYPLNRKVQNTIPKQFKLKRQNPVYLRQKLHSMWSTNKQLDIQRLQTYCDTPYETVVCFLLALEMVKDQKAQLVQTENKTVVELI